MMPPPMPQQGQQPPTPPDDAVLAGVTLAHHQLADAFQQIMPMFEQAWQVVQQKQPQPQIDPAIQKTFEAAMAEVNRKAQEGQARLQFDQQKQASADQLAQLQESNAVQLAQLKDETDKQIAVITEMGKKQANELLHQVALLKNEQDNNQHQLTELLKNRDDNQTNVLIEAMKQHMATMQPQQQATVEPQQNDAMLKQMQDMLNKIEQAKTGDALTATVDGLRQLMAGQQAHQERTLAMAHQLLNSNE